MTRPVHEMIEGSVSRFGGKEAVKMQDVALTYIQLDALSRYVASLLTDGGVEKSARIGIYLEKSPVSVASIIGILRAGCVYVPLDCNSPLKRTEYIVSDCAIDAIVTNEEKAGAILEMKNKTGRPRKILLLNGQSEALNAAEQKNALKQGDMHSSVQVTIDDTAAILYTSGTTGSPKGAMITHRNISEFVKWVIPSFEVTEDDRLVSHAPFHFDLSLLDIFAPLVSGGTIVLIPYEKTMNPKYLSAFISQEKISLWQSVPSVLVLLAEHGDLERYSYDRLKHVLFAGERFHIKYLRKLMTVFKKADFYNIYGCTETNDTLMYKVPLDVQVDPIPLGKPLPYVKCFVGDQSGNPVQPDQEGELFISAPTVMQGYWGNAEKTKEIFFVKSVGGTEERYYRTKDVVKISEDGNYHLLGRTDNIIKSNGYRVNLLEIEKVILSNAKVREAAAVAIKDDQIGNRIIAVVAIQKDERVTSVDLKRHCAELLPKYMIPHLFEIGTTDLPKTSSGKIDKQWQIRRFQEAAVSKR